MSIIAAGVIAVAAALLARRGLEMGVAEERGFVRQAAGVADPMAGGAWCRASDRGITLQTLIVTAVLVLMAVAAGVVIVAITNSSSDDLEEQSQDLEGRCTRTEIYDIELAVAGVKGQQGSVRSTPPSGDIAKGSAVGCIPVCFWVENDTDGTNPGAYGKIDVDEIKFIRKQETYLSVGDPGETATFNEIQDAGGEVVAVFSDPTTIAGNHFDHGDPVKAGYRVIPIGAGAFHASLTDPAEVRVAPDGENCYIYNSSGQIVS